MSTTLSKKLAFISVAAGNPDTVRSFYEKFFGISFAATLNAQASTCASRIRVLPSIWYSGATSAISSRSASVMWNGATLPKRRYGSRATASLQDGFPPGYGSTRSSVGISPS